MIPNPLDSLLVTSDSYYVANGGESAVYRCFTDDDIEVQARDLRLTAIIMGPFVVLRSFERFIDPSLKTFPEKQH